MSPIATDEYVLLDLVVLNEGFTLADRTEYARKTARIASGYGLVPAQSYQIDGFLAGAGPANALQLNLWAMSSPTAMAALGQDAEYQANVAERDRIHDMSALTLYLARPEAGFAAFEPRAGKSYLLDFVIMADGAGAMQRALYTERLEPIIEGEGISRVASFDVLQHLGGVIPEVLELNIYELDSPASMKALGANSAYQAMVPFRNQIHDMNALTLYMASLAK